LRGLAAKIIDYKDEKTYELRLPGEFNQDNARAAAAAARLLAPTITEDSIATSLSHFHGTWRRFELKGKTKTGADLYDDYAHHPTAIQKTLAELRKKTKGLPAGKAGKIIVAFHPHLYSRTRDLLPEFATAFKDADEVIIAPIYAAREIDDGTVSNHTLASQIKQSGVNASAMDSFDEIEEYLRKWGGEGDTVMTMGAGDIYKVADSLVK
jgi:UDP-N-acetylmuramate--alanine ligase